jgi:Tfp pilus assembly protein PilX
MGGRKAMTRQQRIDRLSEEQRQELSLALALVREAELGHRQAQERLAQVVAAAVGSDGITYRDVAAYLDVPFASLHQLTRRHARVE